MSDDLLEFSRATTTTLDEINGPYAWVRETDYAIRGEAESQELIAALLRSPSYTTNLYAHDESHGPYLVSAIGVSSFSKVDENEVHRLFIQAMQDETDFAELDPDRIFQTLISSRISGRELYLLEDLGDWEAYLAQYERGEVVSDGVFSESASVLGGWLEVVAISRHTNTLGVTVFSSD